MPLFNFPPADPEYRRALGTEAVYGPPPLKGLRAANEQLTGIEAVRRGLRRADGLDVGVDVFGQASRDGDLTRTTVKVQTADGAMEREVLLYNAGLQNRQVIADRQHDAATLAAVADAERQRRESELAAAVLHPAVEQVLTPVDQLPADPFYHAPQVVTGQLDLGSVGETPAIDPGQFYGAGQPSGTTPTLDPTTLPQIDPSGQDYYGMGYPEPDPYIGGSFGL
jgi:hypothetical protein